MQYEMLKEIIKSLEFSNDRFEIIRKDMLNQEIRKFRAKSKKFIIFKILMNKYKLPEPIAFVLSLIYQYFLILKYKKEVL